MVKVTVVEDKKLNEVQNKIKRNVSLSILTTMVISFLIYKYLPVRLPNLQSAGDRIAFTLQCNVPSVLVFMFLIGHVGNCRFNSEQMDPLSTKDKHVVEIPQRVLQNTFEQLILSLTLQLAASTWFTPNQMKLIPIVVLCFVVGRILFYVGYNSPDNNRTNRSVGFSITFWPSVALSLFCVYNLFVSLLG